MTDYIATLLCATSRAPPTCPVSRWHQPQLPRALLAGARLGMQGRGRRWRGSRVWAWDSREGAGRGLRAGKVKVGVTSSPGSRISVQVEQGQRGSGRAPKSGLRSGWQTGGCGDGAAPGVTGQTGYHAGQGRGSGMEETDTGHRGRGLDVAPTRTVKAPVGQKDQVSVSFEECEMRSPLDISEPSSMSHSEP